MIRIFRTRSGLEKAANGRKDFIVDIGIIGFSENSFRMAFSVIEGIVKKGFYKSNRQNLDIQFNFTLFVKSGKKDLIAFLKKYVSSVKMHNASSFSICLEEYEKLSNEFTGNIFSRLDYILFFLAVGATVRLISPHIKGKEKDPAITAIDEKGIFAVSVLSGHAAGANEFTEIAASMTGAIPVITTATDVSRRLSIDLFSKSLGFYLADPKVAVKKFNLASLQGKEILIYLENHSFKENKSIFKEIKEYVKIYPDNKNIKIIGSFRELRNLVNIRKSNSAFNRPEKSFLIYISRKSMPDISWIPSSFSLALLRPVDIVVGLGCNRNTGFEEIEEFVVSVFNENNLSLDCIRNISTIDIKRNERGILKFGNRYGRFIDFFSAEEINRLTDSIDKYRGSICFKETGAYSVSEPCAILSSNNKELLICKRKIKNATMAAAILAK